MASILAITAITGVMLGVMQGTEAATIADDKAHIKGQIIVESEGESLTPDILRQLRQTSGVQTMSAPTYLKAAFAAPGRPMAQGGPGGLSLGDAGNPPSSTPPSSQSTGQVQNTFGQTEAAAVAIPDLVAVEKIETVEGNLHYLAKDQVAVRQEYIDWYGVHVGSVMQIGFFDGRSTTVHVEAIVKGGAQLPDILLSPEIVDDAVDAPHQATILLAGGVDAAKVARKLAEIPDIKAQTVEQWYKDTSQGQQDRDNLALYILAGPASIFALVAIINNLIMAFSRRRREFATFILLGASRSQLRNMVIGEALLVVLIGLGIATIFILLGLGAYSIALRASYGVASFQPPWLLLGFLSIASLVTAILVNVTSLWYAWRTPPVVTLGIKE